MLKISYKKTYEIIFLEFFSTVLSIIESLGKVLYTTKRRTWRSEQLFSITSVRRCQFSTLEQCQEWPKRLSAAGRPPSSLEHLFSFAFHAWCMDVYAGEKEQHGELCRPGRAADP